MNQSDNFVIRVYGLVLNDYNQVLVTDEYQLGMEMTKFPGGGLHFGEGTIDCLKREFIEECNGQELKDIRHFYTTDFYQKALFYENAQLLSIYYLVELELPLRFPISTHAFDFPSKENGNQSFRWLNLKSASAQMLTFPIDQKVLLMLKDQL
ncbi:MAG TPA: NUDIX domain-containing protein [Mariniphaga sp.]|nr:NUDIX domain-containing protein [Mariniphaga sp.]